MVAKKTAAKKNTKRVTKALKAGAPRIGKTAKKAPARKVAKRATKKNIAS